MADLAAAAQTGDAVALVAALAAGADPTASHYDGTPLRLAAMRGHLACVQALLAAGADPIATDQYGITPLQTAAGGGHTACMEALLAAGANPPHGRGWTAVNLAVFYNCLGA